MSRRVRELLEADRQPVRSRGLPVRVLATTMGVLVLVVALAAALPSIALAAVGGAGGTAGVRHCDG